jgi:hypothetical protein
VVVHHEKSTRFMTGPSKLGGQLQQSGARRRLGPELDGVDAASQPGKYQMADGGRLGFRRDGVERCGGEAFARLLVGQTTNLYSILVAFQSR